MTCKDCLYFNMCYVLAINPEEAEAEGAETDCGFFADRSRYVVREKGEWEHTAEYSGKCNVCGFEWFDSCQECGVSPYDCNLCPNCGADMRKGGERMSREYPCVYYDNQKCKKFEEPGYTSWCVLGPCSHETPSNADRIRAMSDEELANILTDHSNNGGWITETGRSICYERILDWLRQPAKDGEDDGD